MRRRGRRRDEVRKRELRGYAFGKVRRGARRDRERATLILFSRRERRRHEG